MKTFLNITNKFAVLTLIMILSKCSQEGPLAGNTSETGNAAVKGILYTENGQPAVNAEVKLITSDHRPGPNLAKTEAVVTTTYTNAQGVYEFSSMPRNFYNVLCKSNGANAFIDSIYLQPNQITEVENKTLKSPGSLHGVVRLQPGDDNRSVLIILFGTDFFTTTVDTSGKFNITHIAEGRYNAMIYVLNTAGVYEPFDTVFTIRSGKTDTLGAIIYPNLTSIPVVTGFTSEYDDVRQVVTLRWNKPINGEVAGYDIYRMHQDSAFKKINIVTLTDTQYEDGINSILMPEYTYSYKVVGVDKDGNEGNKSITTNQTIRQAFSIADTIIMSGSGIKVMCANDKGDLFALKENGDVEVYNSNFTKIGSFNIATILPNYYDIYTVNDGKIYFPSGNSDTRMIDSLAGDSSLPYGILRFDYNGNLEETIPINHPMQPGDEFLKYNNNYYFGKFHNIFYSPTTEPFTIDSFECPKRNNYSLTQLIGINNDKLIFADYGEFFITNTDGALVSNIKLPPHTYPRGIWNGIIISQNLSGTVYDGYTIKGELVFRCIVEPLGMWAHPISYFDEQLILLCADGSVIKISK